MELWSRVCFLVLGICSFSRGQDPTTSPAVQGLGLTRTSAPPPHGNETGAPHAAPSQANATEPSFTQSTIKVADGSDTPAGPNGSTAAQMPTTTIADGTTVSMATGSTSQKPVKIEPVRSSFWGYVILILMVLVILALIIILYCLRRVARTYSFDLQRPSPISRNEPTGTFEPVYLDDLDRPSPKEEVTTDDLSPPPVANGTSPPSEEKGPSGETAPQDGCCAEVSAVGNGSPTAAAEDSADKTLSPSNSTSLFFDALGEEQQNENNNHPPVGSSDPFVEINLDEPALCDQLLTSAEAPFSSSSS